MFIRMAAIGLIVLILGVLVPIRTHDVITSDAHAVWNKDELYIFVKQNKLGWSQSLWAFAWSVAKGVLGLVPRPTFKRIDCLVYHVTNSDIDEHLVKDLNAGIFAPYKGSLYAFLGGGPETRGVFRWTGREFARLPASEAAAIESSFTYVDELFAREGWSEAVVLPVRGTADHAVVLDGIPFTVRATQTDDGTSRIELIKTNDTKSVRVVYQFKNEGGFLSAGAYKHLVE